MLNYTYHTIALEYPPVCGERLQQRIQYLGAFFFWLNMIDKIDMSKYPWMPVYTKDILASCSEMTEGEFGAYCRMIFTQWNNGSLNGSPNRLPIANLDAESQAIVLAKFETGDDGRLRNARLEKIRIEFVGERIAKSEGGKKGAEKRWGNRSANKTPNANHNQSHNHIHNERDIKKASSFDDCDLELSTAFYDHMISKFPDRYKSTKDVDGLKSKGAETINKLIRIDGHEIDFLKDVLRFAITDDFWQGVVTSLPRLRTRKDGIMKFDNLIAAYEKRGKADKGLDFIKAGIEMEAELANK